MNVTNMHVNDIIPSGQYRLIFKLSSNVDPDLSFTEISMEVRSELNKFF